MSPEPRDPALFCRLCGADLPGTGDGICGGCLDRAGAPSPAPAKSPSDGIDRVSLERFNQWARTLADAHGLAVPGVNRPLFYILDDHGNPLPTDDLGLYARWHERVENRIVLHTQIGHVLVSTIFLGHDAGYFGGPPVLWETMILGGQHDQYQRRYTSVKAAMVGHAEAVALVRHPRWQPWSAP